MSWLGRWLIVAASLVIGSVLAAALAERGVVGQYPNLSFTASAGIGLARW